MKIYEIGTGYTPIPAQMGAATEIVVEELSCSFLELGEDVEIIDIASSERADNDLPITEVKVPDIFSKKDVSLGIAHKLKRVVYSVALAEKLKNILKETEEKVLLHFHNQYNLFFFLKLVPSKLRQKAVVAYTVHSYIWGTEWDEIENTVRKKYFQEIYCVKNADVVFVLNDITTDHFVNRLGVKPERIHKTINGVSTKKYIPLDSETVASFKKNLGLKNKKIIFQVGSVCDRKNQLGSVKMLTGYLQENKDVVYMYAGGVIDAEYQQSIIAHASENGIKEQVVYAGELAPGTTLNKYYNIADCSVFTSTLESFGLVIIEAIASGTPVIVANKPMFDLKSRYWVYSNENEFVLQIDSCLKKSCGVKYESREVVDKYNWNSVAKMHLDIIRNTEERAPLNV